MSNQTYLLTGATGLIGKQLVDRLLERGGQIYALVRQSSMERHRERLDAWRAAAAAHGGRFVPVVGDIGARGLGIEDPAALPAFDHVVHLAALYDLTAADAELEPVEAPPILLDPTIGAVLDVPLARRGFELQLQLEAEDGDGLLLFAGGIALVGMSRRTGDV